MTARPNPFMPVGPADLAARLQSLVDAHRRVGDHAAEVSAAVHRERISRHSSATDSSNADNLSVTASNDSAMTRS